CQSCVLATVLGVVTRRAVAVGCRPFLELASSFMRLGACRCKIGEWVCGGKRWLEHQNGRQEEYEANRRAGIPEFRGNGRFRAVLGRGVGGPAARLADRFPGDGVAG